MKIKHNDKDSSIVLDVYNTLGLSKDHVDAKVRRNRRYREKKIHKQSKSRKDIDYADFI